MGIEIERKFLIVGDDWRRAARATRFRQGYLALGPPVAVRIRIAGDGANINIKKATHEIRRDEFEFPIPLEEAEEILNGLCTGQVVEKTRHYVEYEGLTWEIDEFEGANAGLIVAEIELEHEDQPLPLPPWVGKEVSSDRRYFNASLCLHPYAEWGEKAE